jgi:hypothetical protein
MNGHPKTGSAEIQRQRMVFTINSLPKMGSDYIQRLQMVCIMNRRHNYAHLSQSLNLVECVCVCVCHVHGLLINELLVCADLTTSACGFRPRVYEVLSC